MEFKHTPVLFEEVIRELRIKPDGIYMDGTLGGGGHSEGICNKLNRQGVLLAVDRDVDALEASRKRLKDFKCNIQFIHSNYSNEELIFEDFNKVDGILLDLGVSSFQLDNASRGFSYMNDAPMDMRMNEEEEFTAFDVVNGYSEEKLTEIIRDYGEERWASRIANFIVNEREKKPIIRTVELAEIIKKAIPAAARRKGPHPAKRTFQAIRIEVNGELSHLKKAMEILPNHLNSGGRMAIISFHSLEDRIVKEAINDRLNPCTCPPDFPICVCGKKTDIKKVSKKPILPSSEEIDSNPRARSAKLRIIEKL